TFPGATKNPAPGIGPPSTRTVQARSRSSSLSAISTRRTTLVPRPFQGHRERRLTLATHPQGGQLARLHLKTEPQLHDRLAGPSSLEFLHHHRADLTDRVQRATQIQIAQPDTGHPITSARPRKLHPDRHSTGQPCRHHLSRPVCAVHHPPPR